MSLSCDQLIANLAEAQTALHQLMTGSKIEVVIYGEKHVTYTRTNLADLRAYVDGLQDAVDACNGVTRNPRRAIQFVPYG